MSDTNNEIEIIGTNDTTVDQYNELDSDYASEIVGADTSGASAAAQARYTALTTDNSYLALLAGLQASVTSLEHRTNLD